MQTTIFVTVLFIVGAYAKPTAESVAPAANQAPVAQPQQPVSAGLAPQQAPLPSEVHQAQPVSSLPQHIPYPPPGYFAPAGVVQVVGNEPQQAPTPAQVQPQQQQQQQQQQQASGVASTQSSKPVVRNFDQYGQPESAAIPPNYKPWGSWGLYIGGNPADGYYTNYYKALSASVNENNKDKDNKPQAVLKASNGLSNQGPVDGYHPYPYSQGDFATIYNQHPVIQPVSSQFGSPSYYDIQGYEHGDVYSTRKGSPQSALQHVQKEAPTAVKSLAETKAYVQQPQSRVYVYSPPIASHVVSPVVTRAQVQEQQQQQVVAYPVPVGSQIVGSQAGVDGAFYPYGVHAYTRYVVKPTLVAQPEQHAPVQPQQPAPADTVYQQSSQRAQEPQQQQAVYQTQQPLASRYHYGAYQPYYSGIGYYPVHPAAQLHYSKFLNHLSPDYAKQPADAEDFVKPVAIVESRPVEDVRVFNEAGKVERRA